MNKISEHDEKLLNLMFKRLLSFENKQVDLSELVRSLESLLHSMKYVTEEWEEKFLNDISNDYLKILRDEYDYRTSKEAIIESIEANEYDFTENGKIHRS